MAEIFISHSSADKIFVELLDERLKSHHIQTWYSVTNIHPGDIFPAEINKALQNANVLLIIVSKNSVRSKWMTKEIATFQAYKPDGLIVPMLLDHTNIDDIIYGLREYQAINCVESWLEGFKKLLPLFGKQFLSAAERRADRDRRAKSERRQKDKRASTLLQRMRKGCWLAYEHAGGYGKHDKITTLGVELYSVSNALASEIDRYKFTDVTGRSIPTEEVLKYAMDKIWFTTRDSPGIQDTAVNIVEKIAEEIYRNPLYTISTIDRRSSSRREIHTDRRSPEEQKLVLR